MIPRIVFRMVPEMMPRSAMLAASVKSRDSSGGLMKATCAAPILVESQLPRFRGQRLGISYQRDDIRQRSEQDRQSALKMNMLDALNLVSKEHFEETPSILTILGTMLPSSSISLLLSQTTSTSSLMPPIVVLCTSTAPSRRGTVPRSSFVNLAASNVDVGP
jgi:hypothetical protein